MTQKISRNVYKGLPNIGNTCYLNSILQCLFSSELFIRFFTNKQIKLKGDHIPVTISFVNLLKEYFNNESPNKLPDPREFKDIFSKRYPLFKGHDQQDAHEFLNCLLEAIHSNLEVSKTLKGSIIHERDYIGLLNNSDEALLQNYIKQSQESWMKFLSNENTEIVRIFYGQTRSLVECQSCLKQECNFEPFNTLQLPIHLGLTNKLETTLEKCIQEFEKPEIIPLDPNNSWKCPQCQQRTIVKKTLQIWKLPKILMIQLKRFDALSRKMPIEVQFPLKNLKLYDYGYNKLSEKVNDSNNSNELNQFNKLFEKKYNLYGMVNHHGNTILGGHYTSMVKLKKPNIVEKDSTKPFQWCILNDGSSKEINIYTKNVSSKDTYMLFYKQKK
jgi:ubiquitin carboxyl-terminal hydrolase 8